MAGLSSIVNLGYHGTSPAIADAIATSGFKGGTVPTWAGKGSVFTSPNINVASRYGPKQLGVVTSAKNLTSPFGGGFNKSGISFGKEIVSNPAQATKGMGLYDKLMSGKYANSPLAKRLLKTGTTAITNPTNWAKILGVPLSALTGILSSTTMGNAELPEGFDYDQEYFDYYNQYGDNYGDLKIPGSNWRQKLMNQKIQQQKKMIGMPQHLTHTPPADVPTSTPKYTGPVTHDFDPKQDTGRRPDKPGGFTDPGKGSYGPHMAYGGRASYFDGGLLSLWPR